MIDDDKTKKQLIEEVKILRQQILGLEEAQAEYNDMESKLLKQSKLLKGVAQANRCLLTETNYNIAISKVMGILGKATGVDRIYIFENHKLPKTGEVAASHRFEWTSKTVQAQIDNAELQNIPYISSGLSRLYEILSKGQIFDGLVREFSEAERYLLENQGILSILIVPIMVDGGFWGYIGFDDCHFERRWSENEKSVLTAMAAGIGGMLGRRITERALSDEKERLAVTLRSIGEGVITTDIEERVVLMNKAAEELTGWCKEEAALKPLPEVLRIIDEKTKRVYKNPLKKILKKRGAAGFDSHTILIDKSGVERYISDTGAHIYDRHNNIIGSVIVLRDITEKLKIEDEIIKANKIESIGILAGGIAHDFNNILTSILGNASLAIMYLESCDKEKIFNRLRDIEKASLQAKNLTEQLLTFAKGGEPIVSQVSVVELMKDAASFILSGSNISCQFSIEEGLWSAEVDRGQISQVINNLIINAKQAMQKGGTIKISGENFVKGEENILPLSGNRYIKISIEDNGTGIPEEYLPKIFDPYFTTKSKGCGLGLATSYSIIKRHNGYITVKSSVGKGTTFFVYLPASCSQAEEEKKDEDNSLCSRRILVMDDEKAVRDVVGMMLNHIGYEADFASSGSEAIEKYIKNSKSGSTFDAVIMDLTIPGGMGGKETIKKLLEIDPKVKAIVSSGYSNNTVMANYKEYGFCGIIPKPYSIHDLSKVLSDVLSKNPRNK